MLRCYLMLVLRPVGVAAGELLMRSNLRALVAALLLAPQAALALGLGDVRLASALNEPLTAEIDLIAT